MQASPLRVHKNYLVGKVGPSCPNHSEDVWAVQSHLNRFVYLTRTVRLQEDGHCGRQTVSAICAFQHIVVGLRHPDGIVSAHGPTWELLSGRNTDWKIHKAQRAAAPPVSTPGQLTDTDFRSAAARLDAKIDPLLVKAFARVESGGISGFGKDGRPIIAYEGHRFAGYTQHKYDRTHPLLSYPYAKKAGTQWKINNKNPTTAWETLEKAALLDHDAALKSCSWGMFQIMGSNYDQLGYDSVDDFVIAMKSGQKGQLDAFVEYCSGRSGMVKAMVDNNFATMASLYNGKDYGDYDDRIEDAYKGLGGKALVQKIEDLVVVMRKL